MASALQAVPSPHLVPVFAGGGTRLPAHIGILQAIENLHIHFDHIVGVSGGSIISALYAVGTPLETIKNIALETNFSQFKGYSLVTLIKEGGLSSGDNFEKWIDDLLQGKTFSDIDLHLHVVATDVSSGTPVIFDRERTPGMKISQAVRYSMSIPLLFSFKQYDDYIMVDGSILSEDALHKDWSGDGTPVLCFRLRSDEPNSRKKERSLIPLKTYLTLLVKTFMNTISREYINEDFWHNTIIVNTGNISPVDFNLTAHDKNMLLEKGYKTAFELIPKKILSHMDVH